VDAVEFDRLLRGLPSLQKTAWLIVSKSGSTIETMLTLELAVLAYHKQQSDWTQHLFVVTEEAGSPLHQFAQKHRLPLAPVPEDVGGRFSVLSPCGLIPAAFLGCSLAEIREGARVALQNKAAVVAMTSTVLASYERGESITMFWSYSGQLREFGGWMAQLWAESLGKKTDRKGRPAPKASTPITAIGACEQHSVLQQVMEGTRDKLVIFQRVTSVERPSQSVGKPIVEGMDFLSQISMGQLLSAEAQATAQALTQVGVSNATLLLPDLSPRSVGELLMFWQLVVGTISECLDINAFDQPGVELGKRLARSILRG
jgi:glucose-6-phosphate isomerase